MSLSPSKSTEPAIRTAPSFAEQAGREPAPATAPPEPAEAAKPRLYRVIWRWHFYAGLFVAPWLLVAAVTGALYVFQAELSDWLYADLRFVEPAGKRLSYDEQRDVVRQAAGGIDPEYMAVWPGSRRSTQFITHMHDDVGDDALEQHQVFYVDPYTGQVLGTQIMEQEFFHVVMELHRTLFAGPIGRVVVELATSWGLVLLITGGYLWWPRNKSRIRGVWLPRLKAKPYVVLRDLHALCGVYVLALAAIVLATGLFVSQVWGTGYMWVSTQAGQSLMEFFARAEVAPAAEGTPPASLESAVASVLAHRRPGDVLRFELEAMPGQAQKAYLMRDDDTNTVRGFDVDQQTGTLLSVTETAELEPMVRVLALAVSLHQGKTFGTPSKVVAFITCLALIALVVSGLWMWWTRRPAGEFGLPQRPRSGALPKWVWAVIVFVGIVLPTVGISIVLIVVAEQLVRRATRSSAGTGDA